MLQAKPSVLSEHVKARLPRKDGERVVRGQRLMQASSDIFLGWGRGSGLDEVIRDYYVRQLRDGKGSMIVELLDATALARYGERCGATLAWAHARGGDRVALTAYLGKGKAFAKGMADFAEAYADINEGDHAALLAAIDSGRVAAVSGPKNEASSRFR